MHSYSDDVDGPVCQAVLQVGYQIGDRIVRPARVAVVEPEHRAGAGGSRRRVEPTSPRSSRSTARRRRRQVDERQRATSDARRDGREVRAMSPS